MTNKAIIQTLERLILVPGNDVYHFYISGGYFLWYSWNSKRLEWTPRLRSIIRNAQTNMCNNCLKSPTNTYTCRSLALRVRMRVVKKRKSITRKGAKLSNLTNWKFKTSLAKILRFTQTGRFRNQHRRNDDLSVSFKFCITFLVNAGDNTVIRIPTFSSFIAVILHL